MLGGLNHSTWPVVCSLVIAAVCIAVAARETQLRRHGRWSYLWPPFWWMTAGLLALLAIGQASDLGQLLADIGRRDALAQDWYESRRWFQTVVVGVVMTIWLVTTLVAIWRVPERRRRYLPMALMVVALVCYGAIRIVSLHQIDALLYHRFIAGAEVGRLVEAVGLSLAFLAAGLKLVTRPHSLPAPDASVESDRTPRTPHPNATRQTSS